MGGYFGTDDIQLGAVQSVLEVDITTLDELIVEKCTVALSQSESVSSQDFGRILDHTVLFFRKLSCYPILTR